MTRPFLFGLAIGALLAGTAELATSGAGQSTSKPPATPAPHPMRTASSPGTSPPATSLDRLLHDLLHPTPAAPSTTLPPPPRPLSH
jgi:hypothetical protein